MAYVPNTSDPDYIRGKDILKRFYDANKSVASKNVNYTFEQMLSTLTSRKGNVAFIESLGLGVNASGFSNSKVQNAMYNLAKKAQGKIPASNADFRNYLIDEGTKVSFVDAITFTVVESAKDVVKGTQAIGESVIFTGKLLNYALPVIAGVVVYFWVMKQK